MRRYWLPDYEKKLIGELQKQQNSAKFCDTLLQTEGISIPTHSSVVAALSLHLSQRLAACPRPPTGQKHRLQFHALKPQTLIKLVGLLYSGELEVNSASEQRDVLAAAHLFGLPDLIEGGKTDGLCIGNHNGCEEKNSWRSVNVKRDAQIQVVPRTCASIGTQTVFEDSHQTIDDHQPGAHSSSFLLHHRCNISDSIFSDTLTSKTCLATCRTSEKHSDGDSTLDPTPDCMSSATSSMHNENMELHLSASESNSSVLLEGEVRPLCETSMGLAINNSPVKKDRRINVSKNIERTNQYNREDPVEVEKRLGSTNVANKSLEKMQEVVGATQISIKVKLRRRRSKEEMWEVVNMQDADDTLSVVNALRQDDSNSRKTHGELTPVSLSSSTTNVGHAQASVLQPFTSSPKAVPHTSHSTYQSIPTDSNTVAGPLQPARPIEETDEQIEKLLEDIMIGLNILPNVDKENKKLLNLSNVGVSCKAPEDKASYYMCYQNCESGNSSTETAPTESGCTGLAPPKLCNANDAQTSTQCNSSAGSTAIRDDLQGSLHHKASRFGEPCHYAVQKPINQEPGSHEEPNVLDLLPLTNDNGTHLLSMAGLPFLPCLSPLDSNNNNSTGLSNNTPGQSSLPGRTWLMASPGSLVFPLSAVAQKLRNSSSECSTMVKERIIRGDSETLTDFSQPVEVLRKINKNVTNNETSPDSKRNCSDQLHQSDSDLVRTDTKINLSPCSVSLSSNNVLAKKRQRLAITPPSGAGEPTSCSTTTGLNLRAKARSTGNIKTSIRTRRELRSTQQTPSHTPEMFSPSPSSSKTEIKLKKKVGRPKKKKKECSFSKSASLGVEKSNHESEQNQNPSLEPSKAKSKMRKRQRHEGKEESPLNKVIDTNNLHNAKPDDSNNSSPTEKRPRLVSMKEFQELIKRQHLKTRHIKDKCEKELSKNSENSDPLITDSIQETELANSHSDEVDVTEDSDEQGQNSSTWLLRQQANTQETQQADNSSSLNEKVNLSGNGESYIEALAKDVTKLSEEKKEANEPPVETFYNGATDSANDSEVNIDEDSSPLRPCQKDVSADHSLDKQTLKKYDAGDLKEARSSSRGSVCQQEDDEEVDVLLHSPDRTSAAGECNNSLEVSPEEVEEDSNDVDVTGDETDVCIDV